MGRLIFMQAQRFSTASENVLSGLIVNFVVFHTLKAPIQPINSCSSSMCSIYTVTNQSCSRSIDPSTKAPPQEASHPAPLYLQSVPSALNQVPLQISVQGDIEAVIWHAWKICERQREREVGRIALESSYWGWGGGLLCCMLYLWMRNGSVQCCITVVLSTT